MRIDVPPPPPHADRRPRRRRSTASRSPTPTAGSRTATAARPRPGPRPERPHPGRPRRAPRPAGPARAPDRAAPGREARSRRAVAGDRVFSLDRWGDHDQAVLVVRPVDQPGPAEPACRARPRTRVTGDATAAIDWYHPSRDGAPAWPTASRPAATSAAPCGSSTSTPASTSPTRSPTPGRPRSAWLAGRLGLRLHPLPARARSTAATSGWHRLGDDPADDEPCCATTCPTRRRGPTSSLSRDGRWFLVHVALGWSRDRRPPDRPGDRRAARRSSRASRRSPLVRGRRRPAGRRDHARRRSGPGRRRAARRRPTPEHWATLVPESDAVIEGVAVTRGVAARARRPAGRRRRSDRYDHDGGDRRSDRAARARLVGRAVGEPGRRTWPRSPFTVVRPAADAASGGRRTRRRGASGATCRARPTAGARTRVEQVRYPSTDGTEIPMFLVRGAATAPGREPAPTILTGYGGFAITDDAGVQPADRRASCDDGGLYAVAGIRGGAEEGEAWHRAGHARAQAAGVRRLRRGRRLARRRGPHDPRPARHPRRDQRRAADGRP